MPMKGKPVEQTVSDIINYLRACRITGMVGGRVQETPNGTTLHVIPGKIKGGTITGVTLPFSISVSDTSLIAAAGIIDVDEHAEEINTTMTNGTWYFRAKVVINDSTGEITSTDVLWSTTEAANTSTDFYQTLAEVDIVSGVPDASTIVQYNYGPLFLVIHGGVDDVWGVSFV